MLPTLPGPRHPTLPSDGLDLVAKTVVDGFRGRTPPLARFRFSQEFAEYRAYAQAMISATSIGTSSRGTREMLPQALSRRNQLAASGIARYILFPGLQVPCGEQARITRASSRPRFATWEAISATPPACSSSIRTSSTTFSLPTRQGQLFRLLHAIEGAEAGTGVAPPTSSNRLIHFQNFQHRRGIVVVLSDFYEQPEVIARPLSRCAITATK